MAVSRRITLTVLAIVSCLCVGMAPTSDPLPSDAVYLPSTLPGLPLPPCTPVRLLPGPHKKKLNVEAVRGPWDQFEVKSSRLEQTERFADFTRCVKASLEYSGRYADGDPERYAGGIIAVGMPVEFLTMWLGVESRREKLAHGREYAWLKAQSVDTGQPQTKPFQVTVCPLAKLAEARSVTALVSAYGRIKRLTLEIVPQALDDLALREPHDNSATLTDSPGARAAYDPGDRPGAFDASRVLAEEGHAPAKHSVGDTYDRRDGVELELTEAAEWIREAAVQYYPPPLHRYGFLDAKGEGVPREVKEAYLWESIASQLGDKKARRARDTLAAQLSPAEIDKVQSRIRRDISSPQLVFKVVPIYPEPASADGIEGEVILQALITRDGVVHDVEVLRSSRPNMGFEEAAIDAVSFWRYRPAAVMGNPISVYFTVFVEFKLSR